MVLHLSILKLSSITIIISLESFAMLENICNFFSYQKGTKEHLNFCSKKQKIFTQRNNVLIANMKQSRYIKVAKICFQHNDTIWMYEIRGNVIT